MPVHEFISTAGQTTSVFVPISAPTEEHRKQVIDGVEYKRLYNAAPLASKDTTMGNASVEDFQRITSSKDKITIGQMQDLAKEMSDVRKDKMGYDPVIQKRHDDYKREKGREHPVARTERIRKELKEKYGWVVED